MSSPQVGIKNSKRTQTYYEASTMSFESGLAQFEINACEKQWSELTQESCLAMEISPRSTLPEIELRCNQSEFVQTVVPDELLGVATQPLEF